MGQLYLISAIIFFLFLWGLFFLVPVVLLLATFKKRTSTSAFYIWYAATIVAGTVILFGILYGKYGAASRDAQGSLILIFLPFYSGIAAGITLLVGRLLRSAVSHSKYSTDVDQQDHAIRQRVRLLSLPILLLVPTVILSISITWSSLQAKIAQKDSSPVTLQRVYERAERSLDTPTLLMLTQNENTPADILESISTLPYSYMWVYVASHPNTPEPILREFVNSQNKYIANNALEELRRRENVKN